MLLFMVDLFIFLSSCLSSSSPFPLLLFPTYLFLLSLPNRPLALPTFLPTISQSLRKPETGRPCWVPWVSIVLVDHEPDDEEGDGEESQHLDHLDHSELEVLENLLFPPPVPPPCLPGLLLCHSFLFPRPCVPPPCPRVPPPCTSPVHSEHS